MLLPPTGTDHLTSLPDELQVLILSFLDPHEWRATKFANYRLTCRRFAAIGAQSMFESFQFYPTNTSKDRLKAIANSKYKKMVNTVDYDGEVKDKEGLVVETDISTGINLFRKAVEIFAPTLKVICALNLHRALVNPLVLTPTFVEACMNLTNLDLHFTYGPNSALAHPGLFDAPQLRSFVERLERLEHVMLGFGENGKWNCDKSWTDPPRILPLRLNCPKLHCIHLKFMTATEPDLLSFLAHLPPTVRDLGFDGLKLVSHDPTKVWANRADWHPAAWKRVFQQIGLMSGLEQGRVYTLGVDPWEDNAAWTIQMEGEAGKRDVEIKTHLVEWLAKAPELVEA